MGIFLRIFENKDMDMAEYLKKADIFGMIGREDYRARMVSA